jgi:hypothetical protein
LRRKGATNGPGLPVSLKRKVGGTEMFAVFQYSAVVLPATLIAPPRRRSGRSPSQRSGKEAAAL